MVMGKNDICSRIQCRIAQRLLVVVQPRVISAISLMEDNDRDIYLLFQLRHFCFEFPHILFPDEGVNLCRTAWHVSCRNVAGFYFHIIGSRLLRHGPTQPRAGGVVGKQADFDSVFLYNGRFLRLCDIGTAACRLDAKLL